MFLAHTLMTADGMVAVECTLRARPDVVLIEPHQILTNAPAPTPVSDNPLKFKVRTHQADAIADLSVIPDRVFGLDSPSSASANTFSSRPTAPPCR